MKPWSLAVAAFILGTGLGLQVSRVYFAKQMHAMLGLQLEGDATKQAFVATFGLGVLNKLEAGEVDRAKSILASEVVRSYHTLQLFQSISPAGQQIEREIETDKETSPALKAALDKTP